MSGDQTTQDVDPEASSLDHFRDMVLQRHPGAIWTISGTHGRIVAGEILVSLQIPLLDPDCERQAMRDASLRLGDGQQWRAGFGKAD